MSKFSEIVTV